MSIPPETIARESPEGVKLETTAEQRTRWLHSTITEGEDKRRILRDIATLLAEVARLKGEMVEAERLSDAWTLEHERAATAREATARAEERKRLAKILDDLADAGAAPVHFRRAAATIRSAP